MTLKCINIVSTQPERLVEFYSLVLQAEAKEIVPGRWELPVGGVTLVITPTCEKTPVNKDCCGLEFLVDDVDGEYARLTAAGVEVPQPPVTYPWGWRAIGIKDPDGNNIDFVHCVGGAEQA